MAELNQSTQNFPNIELSESEVDFGSILNFTDKMVQIEMRNVSVMPIEYCWKF